MYVFYYGLLSNKTFKNEKNCKIKMMLRMKTWNTYSIRRKTARTLLIKDYANSLTNMVHEIDFKMMD